MKQYEELSRLHVNEAIQRGLEAQRVHRARSGRKRSPTFSMKSVRWALVSLVIILSLATTAAAFTSGKDLFARVRKATARFRSTEAAQAAGYDLLPGLDYCFDNPGVGGMGYHYIKASALDLSLDVEEPEAIVYAPTQDGKLEMGAVEYIVPAADWDAAGNSMPPELMGKHLHLNEALGVYVLHAWVWKKNPAGILSDWNPLVSCP